MPIASCGLNLIDDEAVRVAVGLRLRLDLCVPHRCHCGTVVDVHGVYSFVCKRAPSRTARHHALDDLIARGFASASFPLTKEPIAMLRSFRATGICGIQRFQPELLKAGGGCSANWLTQVMRKVWKTGSASQE